MIILASNLTLRESYSKYWLYCTVVTSYDCSNRDMQCSVVVAGSMQKLSELCTFHFKLKGVIIEFGVMYIIWRCCQGSTVSLITA